VSLFPAPQQDFEGIGPGAANSLPAGDIEMEYVSPDMLLYLIIALVIIVVICIIVLGVIRGRERYSRSRIGGETGIRRQRPKAAALLLMLFSRLAATLRYRLCCILQRNTIPGLFAWLESQPALRRKPRQSNESCREFIIRACTEYPSASQELMILAAAMDAHCFGSPLEGHSCSVIQLRRRLRTAMSQDKKIPQ